MQLHEGLALDISSTTPPAAGPTAAVHESGERGVQAHVLNPKSISMSELYGCFNPVTNEWIDGLASRMIRAAAADDASNMHWVVFDGPVTASWVESMNTGGWRCQCMYACPIACWVAAAGPRTVMGINLQLYAKAQCVALNASSRPGVVDLQTVLLPSYLCSTALDDNRMLCLPSGERMRLDESRLRLLFEVQDLSAASPATVSR